MPPTTPAATIVIVTKDRGDVLPDAVASAVQQEGDPEILIVDDGSSDGGVDAVQAAFPQVRVHRFETSAGLVVRRNDAARLARGAVLVSIDDDAVFTAPDTVTRTLAEFSDPRIAAVGIPYIDVRRNDIMLQRAPDDEGCWIGPVFRGTAHAVRRDVFLALGGYRERIVHQGEEADYCLRLLEAGYVVRYGRAAPIHHRESPRRSRRRMERYGRRNEQLLCATYYPAPWDVLYGIGLAGKSVLRGLRSDGGLVWIAQGILLGVREQVTARDGRRPVARSTFALDRRLRRAGCLPLHEVAPALRPTAGLTA